MLAAKKLSSVTKTIVLGQKFARVEPPAAAPQAVETMYDKVNNFRVCFA